ncbi:MAG: bifunctional metallophosphatase/5'-nucleotidase [Bacteroidales bacterium]|nr:bifunctional metallophosphatase/5'-nucleotidase [Bacteroidales bacterium]
MKYLILFLNQTALILFLSVVTATGQELTILHTNDMHSKLTGYGPESEYSPTVTNNDNTLGGFARLATLFADEKAKNKDATLIVDAGDFLMGSLFHVAEEETGFQMNLMKEIGYDVITLGNHEFDFGSEVLANILDVAEKSTGYPNIVCSNIIFDKKSKADDKLEKIYDVGKIKSYIIIHRNGLKIAIFGLVGEDAANVAPSSKPVKFAEPDDAAKEIVKEIKTNDNPDLIICLSHSGVYPSKDGKSFVGEDIELAKKVAGIDIIISGHTHVKTPEAIKINNTYIVQTGSYASNLGEIKLKVENGKISSFNFKLIPVDDKINGDKTTNDKINKQTEFIDKKYLSKTGLTYNTKVAQITFNLKTDYRNLKNSNLGPFISDANRFYLKQNGIDSDFGFVASGTIREDLLKGMNGIITVPDVFRVMSLGKGNDNIPGYPLAKIYISAKELKKLCEVIIMSRASGGDGYLYTSGLKIYADTDKMMLRKVQKVELNGKIIDTSKKNKQLYSMVANGYLLSFIGRIKKMSHGLIKIIPKDKNGNPVKDMTKQYCDIDTNKTGTQEAKEWIALIEYMKSFEKGNSGLSVIPERYKKGDESLVEIEK